ncbi:MAG: YitT family protein [Bacilli bacterium]|nr:YitT family protein [Bacilli bacterium]
MNSIDSNNRMSSFIIINIALLVSSICYNVLLLPMDIVSGGTGGVATILKTALNIFPSLSLLILAIACLIICYIFLGKEKTLASTYISIIYPVYVKMTEFMVDLFIIKKADIFVIAIFAGIISGIASGLIYKQGYNSGGFSIISQILFEKFKIPVAKTTLVMNTTIVLVASLYFGIVKAMYAIIYLYISSYVIDKVILGVSKNKAFFIVTTEADKISSYIIDVLNHGTTEFGVKGGILEKKKDVVLVVIPTKDYYKVKEGVRMIDSKAFFVATDSYEVKGAD